MSVGSKGCKGRSRDSSQPSVSSSHLNSLSGPGGPSWKVILKDQFCSAAHSKANFSQNSAERTIRPLAEQTQTLELSIGLRYSCSEMAPLPSITQTRPLSRMGPALVEGYMMNVSEVSTTQEQYLIVSYRMVMAFQAADSLCLIYYVSV